MNLLKSSIEKISIFFEKKNILNQIDKIGKCNILEDKIICQVDDKKIKDKFDKYVCYDLELNGIIKKKEKNGNICVLDTPVVYVIEDIVFFKRVYINSCYNAKIYFKNCTFKDSININKANNIIFVNNKYLTTSGISLKKGDINVYNEFSISCRDINDLNSIKFINDNLKATNYYDKIEGHEEKNSLKLKIHAKNIEFINTKIDTNDSFYIETEKLKLENSDIVSDEIYINADNIKCNNSILVSDTGIMIDNKNNNKITNYLNSSCIIYNGKEIIENAFYSRIREINNLKKYREILINKLNKIKDNCGNYIKEELNKTSNELKDETIIKVLKK